MPTTSDELMNSCNPAYNNLLLVGNENIDGVNTNLVRSSYPDFQSLEHDLTFMSFDVSKIYPCKYIILSVWPLVECPKH